MGKYDVAQICLNGHVISSFAGSNPNMQKNFCDQCGETTIMACPNCGNQIKGYYSVPGVISIREYIKPKYCENCGKPYPWTERNISAAKSLVDISENLTNDEKEDFKKSLEEIIRDTPSSPIAQSKLKKYLSKAGKEVSKGIRDLLIDLVSETISKTLWGGM